MRTLALLVAFIMIPALATAPARAQGKGGPAKPDVYDDLSKSTGVSVQILKEAHADRALATDPTERRHLIEDLCSKPRAEHLGLIAWMSENDKDVKTQIAALQVISVFGLLADREDVLRIAIPVCERAPAKGGQFSRFGIEEAQRLNDWFRADATLTPFFQKVFKGDDFNLRAFAFSALCKMRNKKIRDEIVKPACWEVYRSTKVSMLERRDAIKELVDEGDRAILPEMQKNLTDDGHVAIASAWGLVNMLDKSSLECLRKIDRTAVHTLRRPCFIARCLLDDETCLDEAARVATDHNEHPAIKQAFIGALGEMPSKDKARAVLEKLFLSDEEAVKVGAALGLLKLDDGRGIEVLRKKIAGPWQVDQSLRKLGKAWMCQLRFADEVMRVRSPLMGPLLVEITKMEPNADEKVTKDGRDEYVEWRRTDVTRLEKLTEWYNEYKADAVSLCGELMLQDTLPRLQELFADKALWGHLKFHSLISRWELGDKKAQKDFAWYLPKYDDSITRDIEVKMSTGQVDFWVKRLQWCTVIDICAKAERKDEARYLALLEELLKTSESSDDPMAGGWAKKVGGDAPAGGTGARDEKSPLEKPPEVSYRCRNQFDRRAIAIAAAHIGGEKAAPQLARALRDSRSVVRAAALEEIGRVSGKYALDVGAGAAEEHKVFGQAVAWLKEKGAWPD